MTTKPMSLFLGFNKSKTQPRIEHHEIVIEGEAERPRRFSLLSGFTGEKKANVDDGVEIIVSREGRRSRRFSQLLPGPTRELDDEFSLSREEKSNNWARGKLEVATMVFKLFHVRTSRQGANHKRHVSTRSAASFKPQPRKSKAKKERKIKVTVSIKPFWKQRKERPAVDLDTDNSSLTPTLVKKSLKGTKHGRSSSVCDSKFSSISSAISFKSLPHELLAVTAEQVTILLHLARKVERSLQDQERLTTNFSTNLAHLFARKERMIGGSRRLSKELQKMLMAMMAGLRDLVGKTFLKKAVFIQRSLQLVHDFSTMLEHGPPSIETKTQEINELEATLLHTSPPSSPQKTSITVSEFPASSSSLSLSAVPALEPKHQLDIHHFQHTLHVLREDIDVQHQLDAALRAGIVGPCEDLRFPATVEERIAMRRFVLFVDGCLGRAGKCYRQEAQVVKVLEMLGSVLEGVPKLGSW